jgi:hypothetical protein
MKHSFEKQVFHEVITTHEPINNVKIWRGLLQQSGTNPPVATVLENSLGGDIVWAYGGVGWYTGTLEGAFPAGKTFISINAHSVLWWGWNVTAQLSQVDEDKFYIGVDDGTALDNGGLDARVSALEIRVYP